MDWSEIESMEEFTRMAGNVGAAGKLFEPEDGHDEWTLGWLQAWKIVSDTLNKLNK